jgi:hypothetical protein
VGGTLAGTMVGAVAMLARQLNCCATAQSNW